MSRRLLPCGETAVLVELDSIDEVLALDAAVRVAVGKAAAGFDGVLDVVPAARTLLVTTRDGADLASLRRTLATLGTGAAVDADRQPSIVEVVVRYDGPDLEAVATLTGLRAQEVVDAHTRTPWRFAFGGFAPGFAYLAGGDARLDVPRRSEPRTAVPAGSVGLAGTFSGIYPYSSPGGWQLIGHTDAVLWDAKRGSPALLRPGTMVRFADADLVSRR